MFVMLQRLLAVRALLAVLMVSAVLAACGGGVWIGYNGGDQPPQVSLAAVSSASVGESLRLAAAASDDGFVDHVTFYRLDDNGHAVLLGDDDTAPYEWLTTMPTSSTGAARFFARAYDNSGQWADSDTVRVVIAP